MSEAPVENPRPTLKAMLDGFERSSNGLFSCSNREYRELDRGLYGYVYARPVARISRVLGIDKEVLCVCSNFPNQQLRSIAAAHALIESSDSRLDPTVVIFIHKDENGNEKLKTWGRERKLHVLPICNINPMPIGDELERLLARELYSHDPFDLTGPVSDDNDFYGRRTEAQELAKKLTNGQIRSILGIRKIGKTSVLNRVVSELKDSNICHAVLIDASRDEIWGLSGPELMASISIRIQDLQSNGVTYGTITPVKFSGSISDAARSLEESCKRSERPVVILIDEADYITPGSPIKNQWATDFSQFWRNFRAVYQELTREQKKISILVSGVSSKWFREEEIGGSENPALNLIPEEYLSPLARQASVSMLKRIGRFAGLRFDDSSATAIAKSCADMPFWMRKVGSHLHRTIPLEARPIDISTEHIEGQIEAFISSEGVELSHVAIKHLSRVYPELAAVLRQLTEQNKQVAAFDPTHIGILEKYGIVIRSGSVIQFAGAMVEAGVRRWSAVTAQGANPILGSQAAEDKSELSEWAEDLADVGRRRNIVERQLREMALQFIRFDSLAKNQSTAARILSVIDTKRHPQFAGMAADAILEKIMWPDLVRLVSKEWQLFDRIYADKSKFEKECDVINDRPDAHAKKFDQADFALYRRSLKFLEDAHRKLG